MKSVEPILENFDKIVYYDMSGKIISEQRLLNTSHPHTYHSVSKLVDKKIQLDEKSFKVMELSIDYVQRPFGTLHVTHLKIKELA